MAYEHYNADGGAAFPVSGRPGMTLRDYFAGQFLAGLMAGRSATSGAEVIAQSAYQFADAMLAERSRIEAVEAVAHKKSMREWRQQQLGKSSD